MHFAKNCNLRIFTHPDKKSICFSRFVILMDFHRLILYAPIAGYMWSTTRQCLLYFFFHYLLILFFYIFRWVYFFSCCSKQTLFFFKKQESIKLEVEQRNGRNYDVIRFILSASALPLWPLELFKTFKSYKSIKQKFHQLYACNINKIIIIYTFVYTPLTNKK